MAEQQQNYQEARERFVEAQRALQKLYIKLFDLPPSQEDRVALIKRIAAQLSRAYSFAEVTPEVSDNMAARKTERQILKKIEELSNSGDLPKSIDKYFAAASTLQRVKELATNSEARQKLLADVMKSMRESVADANSPELDEDFQKVTKEIDELRNQQVKGYDRDDLEVGQEGRLATKLIKWDVLSKEDDKLNTPIQTVVDMPNLKRVVELNTMLVDGHNSIDDKQKAILIEAIDKLHRDEKTYKVHPEVTEQVRNLLLIIDRIIHESNVNEIGRDKVKRGYLRPTTKEINPLVYGEMMQFIGDIGTTDIDDVETAGIVIANAKTKKGSLPPEDIAMLKKFRDEVISKKKKYVNTRVTSESVSSSGTLDYLGVLLTEMDKYVNWADKLIREADNTTMTVATAAAGEKGPATDDEAGWKEYLNSVETVEEHKVFIRRLIQRNNSKTTYEKLTKSSAGQGRFENALFEQWKARCIKFANETTDDTTKDAFLTLRDRYIRTVRLFDFDVPNGTSRYRSTNYKEDSVRAEITTDEVAGGYTHQDIFYFLLNESVIFRDGPHGERVPRYPGKIDHAYELADQMRALCLFMLELDSEIPDPEEDDLLPNGDPNPNAKPWEQRKGRYWGYNYTVKTNAKDQMKKELRAKARDLGMTDDEEINEIVEMNFSLMTSLNIGVKKELFTRLSAISPREDEDKAMKKQIIELMPEAQEYYSAQKTEKPLERALYTELSESVLHVMENGTALDYENRKTETHTYLHNLENSIENTRIYRETYAAPLREPYEIHFLPGYNLLATPMPDLIQLYLLDVENTFKDYTTMKAYFAALEGHEKFNSLLTAKLQLPKGLSEKEAQDQLLTKLEELFNTFSLIKNVPVDWDYYAKCVLYFVDKMYYAYTHRNMVGHAPAYSDPQVGVIESEAFASKVLEKFGILTGTLALKKKFVATIVGGKATPETYAGAQLTKKRKVYAKDGHGRYTNTVVKTEELGVYYKHELTSNSPDETRRRRPYRRFRWEAADTAAMLAIRKRKSAGVLNLANPDFLGHFEHSLFGTGEAAFKDAKGAEPT